MSGLTEQEQEALECAAGCELPADHDLFPAVTRIKDAAYAAGLADGKRAQRGYELRALLADTAPNPPSADTEGER